jgi:hypothetical protein
LSFTLLFALMSFVAGIIAASYWLASTRVSINPAIHTDEKGDKAFRMMEWIDSVMATSKSASQLNRRAAIWTTAAVIFSGLSAVVGAWPP